MKTKELKLGEKVLFKVEGGEEEIGKILNIAKDMKTAVIGYGTLFKTRTIIPMEKLKRY